MTLVRKAVADSRAGYAGLAELAGLLLLRRIAQLAPLVAGNIL
jgi:hypothetical protein